MISLNRNELKQLQCHPFALKISVLWSEKMVIKQIIYSIILLLFVFIPLYGQEIDETNWKSNPKIKKIRSIYKEIQDDLDKDKYEKQSLSCSWGDQSPGISGDIYKNQNGTIRYYEIMSGSGPSFIEGKYYYSSKGNLRFSFFQLGAIYGTEKEKRVYFDENGKHLYTYLKPKGVVWKGGLPENIINPLDEYACLSYDNRLKLKAKIQEIKQICDKIDTTINTGVYKKHSKVCATGDGSREVFGLIYIDKNGIVRKYGLDGGTGDSSGEANYYYSKKGILRFSFIRLGYYNGTDEKTRTFFDKHGHFLFSETRLVGPGCACGFAFDGENPLEDFNGLCEGYEE